MKKTFLLLALVLCSVAFAADFNPVGNATGRGVYNVYNFTNVSADTVCFSKDRTDCLDSWSSVYSNISAIWTQNTSIYAYLNALYTNVTALQTQTSSLNTTLLATYSNISALQTQTSSLNTTLLATYTNISALQTQTSTLNTTLQSTYTNLTALQTQTSTLNTTLIATYANLTGLNTTALTKYNIPLGCEYSGERILTGYFMNSSGSWNANCTDKGSGLYAGSGISLALNANGSSNISSTVSYTNGTGLNLASTTFSVQSTYRLPQTCVAGQIPELNSSGGWDCGADDAGGGSYDLNITADSGSGVITDGEILTVTGAGSISSAMSSNTLTLTGTDVISNVTAVNVTGTTTKTLQLNQTHGATTIFNVSWTDLDTDTDTISNVTGLNVTGTSTKTLQLNQTHGATTIFNVSWTDLDTDTISNVTLIGVTGTGTKTLQINQTHGTNTVLNASWTDLDTNDTTAVAVLNSTVTALQSNDALIVTNLTGLNATALTAYNVFSDCGAGGSLDLTGIIYNSSGWYGNCSPSARGLLSSGGFSTSLNANKTYNVTVATPTSITGINNSGFTSINLTLGNGTILSINIPDTSGTGSGSGNITGNLAGGKIVSSHNSTFLNETRISVYYDPFLVSQFIDYNGIQLRNVSTIREVSMAGLVAAWGFENMENASGEANSSLFDGGQRGFDLQKAGTPNYFRTGGPNDGGYYNFSASGDQLNAPYTVDQNSYAVTREITISVWVKFAPLVNQYNAFGRVISKNAVTNNRLQLTLFNSSSLLVWQGSNSSATDDLTDSTGTNVTDGQWHHIVVTWDACGTNYAEMWIDGTMNASRSQATSLTNCTGLVNDTGAWEIGENLAGFIDNVMIWDRILSDDEINTLYQQRIQAPVPIVPMYSGNNGINVTGTTIGLNTTGYVGYNSTCSFIFYNSSGGAGLAVC